MEFQTTRQDVAVNELLLDETVEVPVDADITLPDYCPDVARILKCKITPRIQQKTVSAGNLTVEGTANVHLLYADSEGEVRSYEMPVGFSKSVSLKDAADNAVADLALKSEFVNCRAVNPRRAEVHGALTFGTKVWDISKKEIVADAEGEGTQVLRDNIPATSAVRNAEKYLVISDEFDLEEKNESVRTLLRADVRAVATETKIIADKVIVKGDLVIKVLYTGAETGKVQTFRTVLPISQIVDVPGVTDECVASVTLEVANCDIRPRTDLNGETRILALTAKIGVGVRACVETEIPVVYDAFSTRYETEVERSDLVVEKEVGNVRENYLCKKTLDLPGENPSEVLDLWCDGSVGSVKVENNQLCVAGTVLICILAKDAENQPFYLERPVEYEYRHDLGITPKFFRCDPKIVAVASDHALLSDNRLEVRVELSVDAKVFEQNRVAAVTNLRLLEDKPKAGDNPALIVYYADKGENLWEIARKYNTSPDEIAEMNELDSKILPVDRMLLIPGM